MNCINCNSIAQHYCAKCAAPYCSRECQVGHWPTHQSICRETARRLRDTGTIMLTNIACVWAHNIIDNTGAIIVEINETLADYCAGESFHIAHISFDTKKGIPVAHSIPIIYQFKDATRHMRIDISDVIARDLSSYNIGANDVVYYNL